MQFSYEVLKKNIIVGAWKKQNKNKKTKKLKNIVIIPNGWAKKKKESIKTK